MIGLAILCVFAAIAIGWWLAEDEVKRIQREGARQWRLRDEAPRTFE
jgi:hypothetical protein